MRGGRTETRLTRRVISRGGWVAAVACVLGGAACSRSTIVPASTARVVANQRSAAQADAHGVYLTVSGEAWPGPEPLAGKLTAMKVTITNESGHPVSVLYRSFGLKGAEGRVYRPIPPVSVARVAADAPQIVQTYDSSRFWVAPYLERLYPSLVSWRGPFPYDEYVDRAYNQWPEGLPTERMLTEALPEGVLGDRGFVAGWVFFPNVKDLERNVDFALDVVHGQHETQVAGLRVPMKIR